MITLNIDKELVRIDRWEDVISRPGYVSDLDPTTAELSAIIGSYQLIDDVYCGLTSCHQPHRKGYLVTTKDGRETNIGNICGKKHFSVEFESLRKQFHRDVRMKAQRETIQAFQSRVQEYESRIAELRADPYGADWIHKKITILRTPGKGFPERARSELSRIGRVGDPRLMRQRVATGQEIEREETILGRSLPRPHYVSEQIGTIEGLIAIQDDNDLRNLLILDLEVGLERLASIDVGLISEHQLALESRWVGEIDGTIEKVEKIIAAGKRLLTKKNLGQFMNLLEKKKEDERTLREFIKDLPDA